MVACSFILVGGFLRLFRHRIPRLYGRSEIVAGALACWVGLNPKENDSFIAATALAGGVYLIASGFEDLHETSEVEIDTMCEQLSILDRISPLSKSEMPDFFINQLLKNVRSIRDPSVRAKGIQVLRELKKYKDLPEIQIKTRIQEFYSILKDGYLAKGDILDLEKQRKTDSGPK